MGVRIFLTLLALVGALWLGGCSLGALGGECEEGEDCPTPSVPLPSPNGKFTVTDQDGSSRNYSFGGNNTIYCRLFAANGNLLRIRLALETKNEGRDGVRLDMDVCGFDEANGGSFAPTDPLTAGSCNGPAVFGLFWTDPDDRFFANDPAADPCTLSMSPLGAEGMAGQFQCQPLYQDADPGAEELRGISEGEFFCEIDPFN
jgi:hypothetical protein